MSHLPSPPARKPVSHRLNLPPWSGCEQVSLGTENIDLSFYIHSFYFLNPEGRFCLEPSLRLIPSYDTNVTSPLLQDLQEPLPPPPGSFPGMLRYPPSPSFQSLTVGLCESGLKAAWGSLRAGLSPSYHRVPSGLKRGLLHKQLTQWEDATGWRPLRLCVPNTGHASACL